MTSLDFQSLLKQEKALQRAELLKQKNAAQLKESVVLTGGMLAEQNRVKTTANPRELRPSADEVPGEEGESKEEVALEDEERRRVSSQYFAELADRPLVSMEKMRVGNTPTIFYAPSFISEADEREILAKTYTAALSPEDASDEWVTLRSRRLKCWGGQPGEGFRPEALPRWMEALCEALVKRGVFSSDDRPNHVLLNEYQPGQGIMPHTDGPFYAPRTATLSLGSDAIMHFSPRVTAADIGQPGIETRPQASLVLRERCLVVFADEAYSSMLHGIDAAREETVGARGAPVINAETAIASEGDIIRRKLRVSLTFRRVRSGGGDEEKRLPSRGAS